MLRELGNTPDTPEFDPLLSDEALLKSLVATPAWWKAKELLMLRQKDVTRRAMSQRDIGGTEMARLQREYSILQELLTDPVSFFMQNAEDEG